MSSGSSKLRDTKKAAPGKYFPDRRSAMLAVHYAVEAHPEGLCHGALHDDGLSCAIGTYWDEHDTALDGDFIDEVAFVNDCVPHYTPKQRRQFMLRWLKWKLTQMGVPGFRTNKEPRPKPVAA